MSNQHNKKRNVGIIYEQLLRRASAALVDNDTATASKCTSLIKKYYSPGTEIFKEFRLFQALMNTTIKSDSLGLRLIQEARRGVHIFSPQQLEIEKSCLIRDINKIVDDPDFFNQPIREYRMYATVQTLMNDWRREEEADLSRLVDYEGKLLEWMRSEKSSEPNISELTTRDVNSFTVKVMNEKFEKKWGDKLNEAQKSLIRDYIHGKVDESTLESIKKRALRGLNRLRESTDNQVLMEKLDHVKGVVESTNTDKLDDDGIVKFMQITHLYQELEAENE
jgi:DNA-binding ferritin-like protein (Dps family)